VQDDYINNQMRRNTRNLLILSAIPLAVIVLLGVQNYRFLANLLKGSRPLNSSELLNIQDVGDLRQYNVSVSGDELIPTTFQKVLRTKSTTTNQVTRTDVEQRFSFLRIGDRFLLVSSKDQLSSASLTGGLVAIPLEVREHVLGPIEKKQALSDQAFLPFMLNTTEFSNDSWGGIVFLLLLGTLCAVGIVLSMQWSANPAQHPIAKQLRKYGEFNIIRGRIDSEVRQEGNLKASAPVVTSSWFLAPSAFTLRVRPLGELAWAYQLTTQHRVNFVPTHKSYQAKIYDRQGRLIAVQAKEEAVQAMLAKIGLKAPWVVLGFNAGLDNLFKKQRDQFLAAVDQRKAALKAAPAAASPKPQPKKPEPVGVA
jgi:hypothetical protein